MQDMTDNAFYFSIKAAASKNYWGLHRWGQEFPLLQGQVCVNSHGLDAFLARVAQAIHHGERLQLTFLTVKVSISQYSKVHGYELSGPESQFFVGRCSAQCQKRVL